MQAGSEKYKTLVLATLDYLINNHTGELVLDGADYLRQSFELHKIQAEKYGKQGNLGKLQKQLDQFTRMLRSKADLNFTQYIIEQTGYELDIYAELRKLGEDILLRGEIQNDAEGQNVMNLLQLYGKTNEDPEKEELLQGFFNDYVERRTAENPEGALTRTVSSVTKDGLIVETIEIISGPKPKHHEHRMVSSPDFEKSLMIYEWSDGRQASTGVSISFKTASGGIYQVEGIHPEVDAFWADSNTVVIQTAKDYIAQVQHRRVQSFNDVVTIKYVEK
jgi:hypothetical protein